jgi:hypothetical protein
MQILVKTGTGEPVPVKIDPSDTVSSLTHVIYSITNIHPQGQRLFFNGRYLNNNKELREYEIGENATIDLITRVFDFFEEEKRYTPISKQKKPVLLFNSIQEDVVRRIIKFLDIRELVAFSLTSKNAYDLVNYDHNNWNTLAKKLRIGDCKEDCLQILWDESYAVRQAALIISDAEKVLRTALANTYNLKNHVKCIISQDGPAIKVRISNEGKMNVRIPLRQKIWEESISILVYDAKTKTYITTLRKEQTNNRENYEKIILKPKESLQTEFYIEGEEVDRGIIVVACSPKMVIDYLKHLVSMETNPFSLSFWQDQWKNYNETEWSGGRFISNALVFQAPDVYLHPDVTLLDEDECDYTESM